MTKAIILFVLIILLALLSLSSFISTIIGFIKNRKKWWIISLGVCLASVCLFSLTTIYTGKQIVETLNPSPGDRFTQMTGLDWPEKAKVITTGGEFFVFDWESYVVFKTDHAVLEKWLSNPPPWRVDKWKPGPIPSEIPYEIDESIIKISDFENPWYAAREYCCKDQAFHSGDLLIIDLDSNIVWVKSWDY